MIQIAALDPSIVETLSPILAPLFENLPEDHVKWPEAVAKIKAKTLTLWLAHDGNELYGAVGSDLVEEDGKKAARFVLIVGRNHRLWADRARARVERWAAEEGCTSVRAQVRKAFLPLFSDYQKLQWLMEKPLEV